MNWNLELDDAYFDYEKFEEEEEPEIDLPF